MDYFEWNKVIARHFFNEEMSGREVLLYVNEKLIQKLGASFNAGVDDFIKAAKTGTHWATRSGFCQKALQTCEDWRSWKASSDVYPPYIVYLACFVLAAGVEGDFAPHAYYARLRKLLGEPEHNGMYPSFEKMIDLWDDLDKWSKEDQHERLGKFEARIRGSWINVGLPLSQTLLSEDERKYLPNLFDEAGLDPTNAPSPEIMPRILKTHGRDFFEKRTIRVLNGTSQEDAILRNALVGFILDELEVWDGTVIQEAEEGTVSRRVQTGLRICMLFDDAARSVSCYLRFKTERVFPEEGLQFEQSGNPHTWACAESHQGWSSQLKDMQTNPPKVFDAASIDWKEGMQLTDNENHWRARLKGATVRLFLPGQSEGFPDWIEHERLERGVKFLVASFGEDIEKVQKWGRESCGKLTQKQVSGLPVGWVLFEGENANQSCPGVDILSVSSSLRLRIKKGIRIAGNTYLKFPLPEIIFENSAGTEKVALNGTPLKRLAPDMPVWQLPENLPVNEILKVEASEGEQLLRSVIFRLEEPSLPLSFNQTVFRDPYGRIQTDGTQTVKIHGVITDMAKPDGQPQYPQTLPTHLAERVIFIGECPGQIADWPREALPAGWHPMWAIARTGRDVWEVHFCGKPGEPVNCRNELYGTHSERRRWREAIWIRRKVTKPPLLAQLRSDWNGYVRLAENV